MSAATYQVIHFVPDPFTGARVPVAALVRSDGDLRLTVAPHLPGPRCLGSDESAWLLQSLVESLLSRQGGTAEQLSLALGPHLSFAGERALPHGLTNPSAWIVQHLLPGTPPPDGDTLSRGPQRATRGFDFFKQRGVSRWVKKTYDPQREGRGWIPDQSRGLQRIAHWAGGGEQVLLMEPIFPTRRQFDADLKAVARNFRAWRDVMEREATRDREGVLVVYMLAGGPKERRVEVTSALSTIAHRVVDTDVGSQRDRLIGDIRELGERVETQQKLP